MKQPRSADQVEAVKEAILENALDIIVKHGLDGLTMRALAARVNMTAPNLYNYYSGKDEIYLSLVVKGFGMLRDELRAAFDRHSDSLERARAMMEAYLEFGMQRPRYYDIMFTLSTPKYRDYLGTDYEALSEKEYLISMEIVDLVVKAVTGLTGTGADDQTILPRVVQIWSLLHGMVSLHNSDVISYVVEDVNSIYQKTVREIVENASALLDTARIG